MIKKANAFTIVELLIVIVVIAILAAISIVAYTGIQNRANDTAVQSDIRNLAGKVREYQAIEDRLPAGYGGAGGYGGGGGGGPIESIGNFSLAQSSYLSSVTNNFYYCRGIVGGVDKFGIIAASASGNIYVYTSDSSAVTLQSGSWGASWSSGTICPLVGIPTTATSYSYSYGKQASGWFNWTR